MKREKEREREGGGGREGGREGGTEVEDGKIERKEKGKCE